jgi:ubiquinone/menaquinone biosynthesis C-methylase UbiE
MPIGLDKEVERLRNQALITWEKEARNLRWMGLRGDMSVLELGSGPGFVTEALAKLMPDGEVTALEIDPVLIERAEAYLGGKQGKNWRIVQGDVMSTGLPDNSFDFVYGRYLFQHLPDPVGAAKEALRVLKPGGKLVIFDVDDETNIFDPPPSPEVKVIEERMAKAFRNEQASKGGNRLIGRRLLNVLRDAGFEKLDLEAIIMHSLLTDLTTLIPKPTYESMHPMVEAGLITEEELQIMLDDVDLFIASDPVIMIVMFMACGDKPPADER